MSLSAPSQGVVTRLGVDSLTRSHSLMGASWEEGKVVRSELIVAGCDTLTWLDLVEKSLDQISGSIRKGLKQLHPIRTTRRTSPESGKVTFGKDGSRY